MGILGLSAEYRSPGPAHFDIENVIRPNILSLLPYRCARDDYHSGVLLDANENALGDSLPPNTSGSSSVDSLNLHRYPDPSQQAIKSRVATMRNMPSTEFVFLGVGSDEVIDLVMRVCCVPAKEAILITPPTYGMYAVCAQVNDLGIVKINLNVEGGAFQLQVDQIKRTIASNPQIKLIFICSPGNPTGTLIPLADIRELLDYPEFKGIVVVDEAYVDFSPPEASCAKLVLQYANLCVMQTLSKSFGLAGARLGIALAQPPLIRILTNTKAPYNISSPTAHLALQALSGEGISMMNTKAAQLIEGRKSLISSLEPLRALGLGTPIGGNDANFVLVPILRPGGKSNQDYDNNRSQKVYHSLAEHKGVVVRYRGGEFGCGGCVRITIGTVDEMKFLLLQLEEALKETM